jgi:hypothetical protein
VHIAWFEDGKLNVVAVWDSEDDLQRFIDRTLLPAVANVGITTQPQPEPVVDCHELHVADPQLVLATPAAHSQKSGQ